MPMAASLITGPPVPSIRLTPTEAFITRLTPLQVPWLAPLSNYLKGWFDKLTTNGGGFPWPLILSLSKDGRGMV
jgi:hypothetical protein